MAVRDQSGRTMLSGILRDLIPWIVVWVLAAPGVMVAGGGIALLLTLLQINRARRKGEIVSVLHLGGAVFFAAYTAVALLLGPDGRQSLSDWSAAISTAGFALVVVVTVLVGRPFVEPYARASAPEGVWGMPEFRRMCSVLSLAWAAGIGAHAVVAVLIAALAPQLLLANIALFAVAVIAVLVFQRWYVARARETIRAAASA